MSYVITDGSNYIKTSGDNRPTTTRCKELARSFDSYIKAQNVCACLPNTFKKFNFYVQEEDPSSNIKEITHEPVRTIERENIPEPPTITCPAEGLDLRAINVDYIAEEMKRFEDFVHFLREQEPIIRQQQAYADAQIFDIEHAAELTKLNASQGFKIYKLLHEARNLRRQCKDALAMISYINEVVSDGIISRRVSRRIAGMENRNFTPRAIPTVFEISAK